jgi:hypothetical protein
MTPRCAILAGLLVLGCPGASQSQPAPLDARPAESVLALADLQVQSGSMIVLGTRQLAIRTPVTRAILRRQPASALELRFVYRGPTDETVPLASGEVRRQIGLELHVRDTCNLVYVMWHIQPSQGLHVSVKSNPSENWNSQCHDRGYVPVAPSFSVPHVDPIEPNQPRVLAAGIDDNELRVLVDGVLVWSGQLPAEAAHLQGPFGVRSDNGQFDLEVVVHRGSLANDVDARALP